MREYIEIPKVKHRLKLSIEKIPYMKKKRLPYKTAGERLYDRAAFLRDELIRRDEIKGQRMCAARTDFLYNHKDFKEIIEISKQIRHIEILDYFLFAIFTVASVLLTLAMSFLLQSYFFFLIMIPLQLLYILVFTPKVKFRDFFNDIYIPLCYWCANLYHKDQRLSFDMSSKKKHFNHRNINKALVTNRFSVTSLFHKTIIEKKVVRSYVTTYRTKNGNIQVGKKLATIFSGYSFNLTYNTPAVKNNDIKLAILNKNTFYGTDGIQQEEASKLKEVPIKYRKKLGNEYTMYSSMDLDITNKEQKEIQKKIIQIDNEIGFFNMYITDSAVQMMLSVQLNRNGLQEEFFESQIKNPESLNYNSFFSIVKTLYITHYMDTVSKILFKRSNRKIYEIPEEKTRRFNKNKNIKFGSKTPAAKINKKINTQNNLNRDIEDITRNKSGETSLDTAIAVVISVVLSALILAGGISLLKDVVSPTVQQGVESVYELTNSDIIKSDDLK